MRTLIACAAATAALLGCATTSTGVAPLGDGLYMIHGTDTTGLGSPSEIKAALLREASGFCEHHGRELTQVQHSGSQGGWLNTATSEIRFRCK